MNQPGHPAGHAGVRTALPAFDQRRAGRSQSLRLAMTVDACIGEDDGWREHELAALYRKAKRAQWDVERDVDWQVDLDPSNPLGMPDATLLIHGSPIWTGLDAAGRVEVRRHAQGWLLSQILHGEQAALLCAGRLACADDSLAARLCAAVQVMDEARHIEAYGRLIDDKVGVRYPLGRALRSLIEDTVTAGPLDITALGMQILIEGIALSIFQNIAVYSRDPFVRGLLGRIQRDEARHFAAGCIGLRRALSELGAPERREREQFVAEGASLLHEHLCADDIWEPLGFSRRECARLVRASPVSRMVRRSIFRRLVPTVRDLGLLTGEVRRAFEQLDVLGYADLPAPPSGGVPAGAVAPGRSG